MNALTKICGFFENGTTPERAALFVTTEGGDGYAQNRGFT
jgi:hypothetical protein